MKQTLFVIIIFFSLFITTNAQNSTFVNAYIEKYKALAINEMIRTGVPASITLAQGILESGAGQSDLVKTSNNHFGIKCKKDWAGNVVYHDDDAKGECFRSYSCAEESFKDHSDFLRTRANYASLFSIEPADYQDWALGLKKAGYATNPIYAQTLIKTINDYNLQQYTVIALQGTPIANNVAANTNIEEDALKNADLTSKAGEPFPDESTEDELTQTTKYSQGVFHINGVKVIYMPAGVSLFALASNYHINYKKLLDFNEMHNEDILSEGRLIYLERKPKRSNKNFHIVTANETIEMISQKEGVQLESLLSYNNINKSGQPVSGSKIYLHPAETNPKLALK